MGEFREMLGRQAHVAIGSRPEFARGPLRKRVRLALTRVMANN